MDLFCRVTEQGLLPLTAEEQNKLWKLMGKDVRARICSPRNLRFHRKFFALLTIVFDNMPESIAAEKHIESVEALLELLKIDLGYFDTYEIAGRWVLKTRSIAFDKMDNAEFERFYDLAVTHILTSYLQGLEKSTLNEEVEEETKKRKL